MNAAYIKKFKVHISTEWGMQTYQAFLHRLQGHSLGIKDLTEYFQQQRDPLMFVRNAFPWKDTKEGYQFWWEVNSAWTKVVLSAEWIKRFAQVYKISEVQTMLDSFFAEHDEQLTVPNYTMVITATWFKDLEKYLAEPHVNRKEAMLQAIKETEKPEPTPEAKEEKPNIKDVMEFYDFTTRTPHTQQADARMVTIYNNKSWGIRFTTAMSKEIKDSGHESMQVARNSLTGEIFFVFSNEGMRIVWDDVNARINNKALAQALSEWFRKKGNFSLNVSENRSKKGEHLTYLVTL